MKPGVRGKITSVDDDGEHVTITTTAGEDVRAFWWLAKICPRDHIGMDCVAMWGDTEYLVTMVQCPPGH